MSKTINKFDLLILEDLDLTLTELDDTTRIGIGVAFSGLLVVKVLALANALYQRYLSAAGKACAGKSLDDRDTCIEEYRKKADLIYVDTIKKGIAKCEKTNDPERCKRELRAKADVISRK